MITIRYENSIYISSHHNDIDKLPDTNFMMTFLSYFLHYTQYNNYITINKINVYVQFEWEKGIWMQLLGLLI